MFASCMPRVQLYVNACNGWPQFALQHLWLLPINFHFIRWYSAAGRGIAAVSSAIEESNLYLFYNNISRLTDSVTTETDEKQKQDNSWTDCTHQQRNPHFGL